MRVVRLALTDFRNYERADVELPASASVFLGSNGQGKTNLVESLVYLSTLGSHRVTGESALIRHGCDRAVIRAALEHGGRTITVEAQLNRTAPNKTRVGGSAVKPRELPRYVSTVLFAPEDLALVRGDPATRRRFLDELLVQRAPRRAGVLADYDRALRQRTSLLKSARASGLKSSALSTLEIWDERLVELGSEIIDARLELVDALADPVADAYRSVAGADHRPQLAPVLSILGARPDDEEGAGVAAATEGAPHDTRDAFRTALASVRGKELDRGLTLVGPHRDDVAFGLNGLPAKGYASHGESWSFALALKLGSAALLRRESAAGDPVIILDDVFAELDRTRRTKLAHAVHDYTQVLITAAVPEDVPDELAAHTVRIRGGAIEQEPS